MKEMRKKEDDLDNIWVNFSLTSVKILLQILKQERDSIQQRKLHRKEFKKGKANSP